MREDADIAELRQQLALREAELERLRDRIDVMDRERGDLIALIVRLTGGRPDHADGPSSGGHRYGVTLSAELAALLGEVARAHGSAPDPDPRLAVMAAATRRGLRAMAHEIRWTARTAAAERAVATLDRELAASRSRWTAEWRARVDRLTSAIAEARMAFDQDRRAARDLAPNVIGEALLRGLEYLALEHGIVRPGEPLFVSHGLVPEDEREIAESARWANEAAGAHAKNEPDALVRLARAFPSLRGGAPPGLVPWDPGVLDAWAASDRCTGVERSAVSFVLWVANPDVARAAPFSLARALREWDRPHRAVLTVWASSPWWP